MDSIVKATSSVKILDPSMSDCFVGKAKCHLNDEFDFETGKKIAVKRMMEKYNKSKDKAIVRYYKQMKEELECIEEYMTKKNIEF